METTKSTALFDLHVARRARMVPFAGWWMPLQFRGIVAEHQAVRERVGLFDICHMGRLELRGPGAVVAVDRLVTNAIATLADGKAAYTCCCREDGRILDDLIVYRLADTHVLVVANASNHDKILAHFSRHLGPSGLSLVDRENDTGFLALQGPKVWEVLRAVGIDWAENLRKMEFTPGLMGKKEVIVCRTGYTGEDGVELLMAKEDLVELYQRLLVEGATYGIEPAGLGARDTLRLEACLSLYGHEIDETIHPFEAGLGWTVKLGGRDFIGKTALTEIHQKPLERCLVGLEMVERGIARAGYPVHLEAGGPIGIVTSGGPSPTLQKNIALAYIPLPYRGVGTVVAVDCRGKRVRAKVVETPFYRRSSKE